jgi:hypothetical protein
MALGIGFNNLQTCRCDPDEGSQRQVHFGPSFRTAKLAAETGRWRVPKSFTDGATYAASVASFLEHTKNSRQFEKFLHIQKCRSRCRFFGAQPAHFRPAMPAIQALKLPRNRCSILAKSGSVWRWHPPNGGWYRYRRGGRVTIGSYQ